MSFALAIAPVVVTGVFAWIVARSNQKHERAAQQRQETNTSEHGAVVMALDNLTHAFNEHLAWHLEDKPTEKRTT